METRSAPERLRSLASWLINQNAATARGLVVDRLAGAGFRRHHYSALVALAESGPLSQAALGRTIGLDRSDVTAAVGELAERGLADRAPDPDDRRRNVVRITAAGRRQLRKLDRLVASAQDDLLEPLSPAEREQLLGLLARLADHHAG
jgi:DNA-binding MarR family transcriptional regulator